MYEQEILTRLIFDQMQGEIENLERRLLQAEKVLGFQAVLLGALHSQN